MFDWVDNLIGNNSLFANLFAFIPEPMRVVLLSAIALVVVWFAVKFVIDLLVSIK